MAPGQAAAWDAALHGQVAGAPRLGRPGRGRTCTGPRDQDFAEAARDGRVRTAPDTSTNGWSSPTRPPDHTTCEEPGTPGDERGAMTTDYRDHGTYQEVMRAYRQEVFATWLCEKYPWGGVDLGQARVQWLVEDLADFRHYPPSGENDHETNCFLCSILVAPHKGVLALGGRDGANYAATLHRGCAGEARRIRDEVQRRARSR